MLTWTTYGTWLQGDGRGYVKKGETLAENKELESANKHSQVQVSVRLSEKQRQLVRKAILKEAQSRKQHVYALSVKAMHIHVVVRNNGQPISKMAAYYKKAGRLALRETGHTGKLWTRGYDKRFCFDEASLEARIRYVERQNLTNTSI